jgi:hypothetical protein
VVNVTRDEDFVVRRLLTPGPAIVWLRLGNTRRAVLHARIDAELPAIVALLSAKTPSSKLSNQSPRQQTSPAQSKVTPFQSVSPRRLVTHPRLTGDEWARRERHTRVACRLAGAAV